MCQFEYEGKQIKLLLLRLKTRQPKQTFTLVLLPTPPSHLIVVALSLALTSHAYPIHKLLLPLLLTLFRYSAFASAFAFASQKYVHKLHKEISEENKQSNAKPTLRI